MLRPYLESGHPDFMIETEAKVGKCSLTIASPKYVETLSLIFLI